MQLAAEDYAIDPPKQMQFAAEVRAILQHAQVRHLLCLRCFKEQL